MDIFDHMVPPIKEDDLSDGDTEVLEVHQDP